MRKFLLGTTSAILLACAWPAEAQLYVWGGHNYCWYGEGWRGPGWYWCGYRLRRGYGWGGGYGWHGWVRNGRPGFAGERRGNGLRAAGHGVARAGGHGGGHGGHR